MSRVSETTFVLQLRDAGYDTDEVQALRKHFWSSDRVDTNSAAFQIAILKIPSVKDELMKKAAELDAKAKGTSASIEE